MIIVHHFHCLHPVQTSLWLTWILAIAFCLFFLLLLFLIKLLNFVSTAKGNLYKNIKPYHVTTLLKTVQCVSISQSKSLNLSCSIQDSTHDLPLLPPYTWTAASTTLPLLFPLTHIGLPSVPKIFHICSLLKSMTWLLPLL